MNLEEIKLNAPFGATHYDINGRYYMMTENDYLVYKWVNKNWVVLLKPVDFKPL